MSNNILPQVIPSPHTGEASTALSSSAHLFPPPVTLGEFHRKYYLFYSMLLEYGI
jgi:hypothetical protein